MCLQVLLSAFQILQICKDGPEVEGSSMLQRARSPVPWSLNSGRHSFFGPVELFENFGASKAMQWHRDPSEALALRWARSFPRLRLRMSRLVPRSIRPDGLHKGHYDIFQGDFLHRSAVCAKRCIVGLLMEKSFNPLEGRCLLPTIAAQPPDSLPVGPHPRVLVPQSCMSHITHVSYSQ